MPAETKYRAGQPLIIELFAVINDGQPAKQVIECINILSSENTSVFRKYILELGYIKYSYSTHVQPFDLLI
jgi:hypothetical protein